jgi:hypothetical protein
MSAIAEVIKAAEAETADEFRKALELLESRAATPAGGESVAALQSRGIPTAREETNRNVYKWIAGLGGGALAFGAALRMLRAIGETARHKELLKEFDPRSAQTANVAIPMPKKASEEKSAIIGPLLAGAALGPSVLRMLGETAGGAWRGTKETVRKGFEHLTEPTGSPATSPWGIPLITLAGLASVYGGYQLTDSLISKLRESRRSREMGKARKEFEDALRSQFAESEETEHAGISVAAAVDGLAQAYVSGELQEQLSALVKASAEEPAAEGGLPFTRGLGNVGLGTYLTFMALLAAAGGLGGYHFIKSREVPRKKYEAAKEFMLRRQLGEPATVSVE